MLGAPTRRLILVLPLAAVIAAPAAGASRAILDAAPPTGTPCGAADAAGRLVFSSGRSGSGDIYVVQADGSGETRLTTDPADDFDPSWSPNGTGIAFRSTRDGNDEIYVMDADGSNQ